MTASGLPKNLNRIRQLAQKQAATITLGQLMRTSTADPDGLVRQARWLHDNLPVRFARRLDDFVQLPYVVVRNPSFGAVFDKYMETFDAFCAFPEIKTPANEAAFGRLVAEQLTKHSDVAPLISEGYYEVRQAYPHLMLDTFLDNLFATRISTRILLENYSDMRRPCSGHPGVVQIDISPHEMIERLAVELTKLTRSIYGYSPPVEFRGNIQCTLDYIPRHISFMVRELLKNALRATAERHPLQNGKSEASLPKVTVELQKGDVSVIIKISDQGGGLSKQMQQEVWRYGWTTVSDDDFVTLDPSTWPGQDSYKQRKELAGYGFGLPLTRLHAQYFGGDVFMQVLQGHGTDMYLLLNHLKEGTPAAEIDDPSTELTLNENSSNSVGSAP